VRNGRRGAVGIAIEYTVCILLRSDWAGFAGLTGAAVVKPDYSDHNPGLPASLSRLGWIAGRVADAAANPAETERF